jgi:hypothetical protein
MNYIDKTLIYRVNMYFRYTRSESSDGIQYQLQEKISLFGCNKGFIPKLLKSKTLSGQSEPYLWHINIIDALKSSQEEYHNSTLIIDLKPNQNNLSLYELTNVWGYSCNGWTPVLFHLAGLFVDEDPQNMNKENFIRNAQDIDDPIYEFLYLEGTVNNGVLDGRWTAPPVSSTNATLLWPDTLKYFITCMRENTPILFK